MRASEPLDGWTVSDSPEDTLPSESAADDGRTTLVQCDVWPVKTSAPAAGGVDVVRCDVSAENARLPALGCSSRATDLVDVCPVTDMLAAAGRSVAVSRDVSAANDSAVPVEATVRVS